jgi:Uma2 family endonuclease
MSTIASTLTEFGLTPILLSPNKTVEEAGEFPALVRLTIPQYHSMVAQGILEDNNQVEFLEGILVKKMTKNRAHSLATRRLRILLEGVLPNGFYVDSQEPTATSDSEPEPDAMVIRGQPEDYQLQQPEAIHVALIAEVADSSLQHDRGWKKRIYARAGIPTYWIVNLVNRQVEVFTQPSGDVEFPDYSQCQVYVPTQDVGVVLDGKEIGRLAVKDMLPSH